MAPTQVNAPGDLDEDTLARSLERLPAAFAVTRGASHRLVFANAAFRQMTGAGDTQVGLSIDNVIAARGLLDEAMQTRRVVRDRLVGRRRSADAPTTPAPRGWWCTIWPELDIHGVSELLVIELRPTIDTEMVAAVQREVAERMLLSALKERDAATTADASRHAADFLAFEGRRLSSSLDEKVTTDAVVRLRLPRMGAWCIVDTLERDGTLRRLGIVHPDPAKQAFARGLEGRWTPQPGDRFGISAVMQGATSAVVEDHVFEALTDGTHDVDVLHALQELDVGHLLTVPLRVGDNLIGAVTFVDVGHDRPFSAEDIELAKELATVAALAIDRARLHREAIALRIAAEAANEAKNAFLGMMSHELRTPLNAIAGYVELIDMGLRGPVTEAQHADLHRIRSNQGHLLGLITDVLNLSKVASGELSYAVADVHAGRALEASVAIVAPLIEKKGLVCETSCVDTIVARADPDRVNQILVNLLSNAIKFTDAGGRLKLDCAANDTAVLLRVTDTGIGVSADKIDVIFDPFVQVRNGLAERDRGVGLGLSISRGIARAMGGDLTVESQVGVGSTFTLRLPRSTIAAS